METLFDLTDVEFLVYCEDRSARRKIYKAWKELTPDSDIDLNALFVEARQEFNDPDINLSLNYYTYYDDTDCSINVKYLEPSDTWYPKMWKEYSKSKASRDRRLEKKRLKEAEETAKVFRQNEMIKIMESEYGPKV